MKKILATILAGSMIVGTLAGCSSKPEAPAQGGGAPAAQQTIKLGMSAPITGNNAEYGKTFTVATQMALDKINAAGGINGKKVEIVIMDSKGDPKEASEVAKKFGQNKDILAVIGDFSSSSCMAAAPIYGENELVLITPSASHPDLAAMNDYIFGVAGRQDGEAPFLAQYQAQKFLGSKNSAIVYVNNDWGLTVKDNFMKRANTCGLNVVAIEPFMEGEKDFNALLTKVQQSNPDVISVMAQAADAALVTKQIKQMGWDVKVSISGGAFSPQLISLGGKEINGSFISSPVYLDETKPEIAEFLAEFEKRAGYKTTTHAPFTYDAVNIVLEAMKRADDAGKLDRKTIRDEIAATKDFPGYAGPLTFNPAGDVNRKYVIFEIKDDQFVRVTDYDFMD